MGLSKLNLLNSILITLFLLVVLVMNVSAETTFFDQDNAFIMADSTSEGTTGGGGRANHVNATNLTNCIEEWQCSQWSNCINKTQTRSCINSGTCNQGQTITEKRDCLDAVISSIPNSKPKIVPPETSASSLPSITGNAIAPAISLGASLFSIIAILIVAALIGWKVLNNKYHIFLIKKKDKK